MTRKMFDSITLANLPAGADLYAGYDDGHWPDAGAIATRFLGGRVVRITVFAFDLFGDVLDVESGDATAAQAVDWVVARRSQGADPTVYCSTSAWPGVKAAFAARGVPLPWWWRADYGRPTHLFPGDPREVAHQFIDHGPYDESIALDNWPGIDPAPVAPTPQQPQGADVTAWIAKNSAGPDQWLIDANSRVPIIDPDPDLKDFTARFGAPILLTEAQIQAFPLATGATP